MTFIKYRHLLLKLLFLFFISLISTQPITASCKFSTTPKTHTSTRFLLKKQKTKKKKSPKAKQSKNYKPNRFGRASLLSLLIGIVLFGSAVLLGIGVLAILSYLAFFVSFFLAVYGIFRDEDFKLALAMYIVPILVSTATLFLLAFGIIEP